MAPDENTYTLDGLSLTTSQWADRLGITVRQLRWRLARWPVERALTEPRTECLLRSGNVIKNAAEWARQIGITQQLLHMRMRRGYTLEEVLDWDNARSAPALHTVGDRSMTLSMWAVASGLAPSTLRVRMYRGMTLEEAISTAPGATREYKDVTVNGEAQCLSEWARRLGISREAIRSRIMTGWTPEEACSTPKGQTPPRLGRRQSTGRPSLQVEWGGVTHTFKEWMAITGLSRGGVEARIRRGETPPPEATP